jgi:hypothetical protein
MEHTILSFIEAHWQVAAALIVAWAYSWFIHYAPVPPASGQPGYSVWYAALYSILQMVAANKGLLNQAQDKAAKQ